MVKRYVSKPVEIDAYEFDGTYENAVSIRSWSEQKVDFMGSELTHSGMVRHMHIDTLEGTMKADPGDYIIKGLVGEFYPCKPDVFKRKYEEVKSV